MPGFFFLRALLVFFLIYWSRGATTDMHVVRVLLAFLLLTWSVKAAVYGPQPTLHILTFCPSNCDSTATSWTNPVGASNATASYCAAGGAINTAGVNGQPTYLTWTQGAWAFSTPTAWGGIGGQVGLVGTGGAGGGDLSIYGVNGSTTTSLPAYAGIYAAGGAGGAATGTTG